MRFGGKSPKFDNEIFQYERLDTRDPVKIKFKVLSKSNALIDDENAPEDYVADGAFENYTLLLRNLNRENFCCTQE